MGFPIYHSSLAMNIMISNIISFPPLLGIPTLFPKFKRLCVHSLIFHTRSSFQHTQMPASTSWQRIWPFSIKTIKCSYQMARDPPHMKIPKLHYLQHAMLDIKHLGALDGLSTETMETLHRLVKAAYPLTNRRQFKPQIIRKLQHVESVCLFSHYMQYMVPSITSGIL